ncbi:MAG: hypothetical protein ACI3XS_02840 [Eubacteriales bacterium]
MKNYIVPEMEIEEVSSEDIISTSGFNALKGGLSGSSVTTDDDGNKAFEGVVDITGIIGL